MSTHTKRDFMKEKEAYYKMLVGEVYVDPQYRSKTVKCKVCNEDFHYINSKEELLNLVNAIDDKGDFGLEMAKLMTKFYFPGRSTSNFHDENMICSCCYINKPKKSFKSKIKKFIGM